MAELAADSLAPNRDRERTQLSIWSERLLAVRKQWHLVALSVLIGLVMAVVYLGYATRYYRSQATLMVQRERSSASGQAASVDVLEMYRTEYLRTQLEMVRDPDTLAKAYAKIQTRLKSEGRNDAEIEALLPELTWANSLEVKPVANALVFYVQYEHANPRIANTVVDEVVQAFIQKERQNRKDRVERNTESQKLARDTAFKEMQEASRALEHFQVQYKLVDPTISNSIVRKKYDDLAARRNDLLAKMDQARALHEQCEILSHLELTAEEQLSRYALLDFGDKAAMVRSLELALVDEDAKLTQLSFDNGPKHWEVTLQKGKIAALNRLRLQEYQRLSGWVLSAWQADTDTLNRYRAELDTLQQQSLDYQTATTQFQVMQKDLDSKADYYARMKDELATLENQVNSDSQSVSQQGSVYDWPRPVRPTVPLTLVVALALALALGLTLALLVEYLDDSIKHPEDLAAQTGFTPLGLIPHVPETFTPTDKINYITRFPQTSFSESFRSLRVNLIIALNARDITNGVLAVTSSVPKEGKSLVTSNLAASFVQSGKKTLLLQADLRRPTAAELYGLQQADIANCGTTAALTGQTPYAQCVHPIHDNLYLMPCGTCPPNPSELIGSKMKALVDWARTQFDMVIIDTPPLINVSDTLLITPLCDGILMVIHGGSTSGRLVRRTQEMLVRGNALILGAVINDVTSAVARHHRFAERYGIGMYSYYSHYYTKYGYSSDHEVDLNPAASSGSNKAMD